MKIYAEVPRGLVDDWVASKKRHGPGAKLRTHYHPVEEWLQVEKGEISFFSAGGREYRLGVGQALHIPRGEVHRVEIGPNGVEYRMWVPVDVGEGGFGNVLDAEAEALVEKNLEVPNAEDHGDGTFFEDFLSEQLTFRTAPGAVLDKAGFTSRGFKNRKRKASDSVRVLHQGPDSVLLVTTVEVPGDGGGIFSNERLFVREGTRLMCRVWLNYPEPAGR
jgi:cupin domain